MPAKEKVAVRDPDQDAVSKLCLGVARDTGLLNSGCRTLAGIVNRGGVKLHHTLLDKICAGQRKVSPATKKAIFDGLDGEIERLRTLRADFKKRIK